MVHTLICPTCGATNEQTRTHCFACGQFLTIGQGLPEAVRQNRTSGFALAGFVLGLCNLILGLIPFYGLIPAAVGIILSCCGLGSVSRRGLAIAGLILSCLAVVMTLCSCALWSNMTYPG
ncbi:hypothetical protein Krac_7424 [Ktedonobacter racemifer DSM 44963]|uniref:RanBP2-type domain-containing protein n=1 Tax=Ktedonobacter racemifer DSM 44963 TaxID=485913 RepID=D6TPM9_KTERA|nr:hypothetical protein Krac_6870 [Ktedonobacter racemifer DSM 44963]EFH86145.1 hypothetical protein Krac_7424 [Ktedonobacter racemifer DSM 44963]